MKHTLRFNSPPDWNLEIRGRDFIGLCEVVTILSDRFQSRGNLNMLEIGSFMGESTFMFASSKLFDTITCIDPYDTSDNIPELLGRTWNEVETEFNINTRYFNNITLIKDFSYNVVDTLSDQSYDFIYIDGGHSYEDVKQDILLTLPKLKQGGIIAGHDYNPDYEGVIRAVNETVGKPEKVTVDNSWIKYISSI